MAYRTETIINFGILLIFVGFIIILFGSSKGAKDTSPKTKVAVGGFIGPIPFGFGNDKNLIWFAAALSLVLYFIWLAIRFKIVK